jgi:hypothetical protein
MNISNRALSRSLSRAPPPPPSLSLIFSRIRILSPSLSLWLAFVLPHSLPLILSRRPRIGCEVDMHGAFSFSLPLSLAFLSSWALCLSGCPLVPSILQRVLYHHSPFGHVAHLGGNKGVQHKGEGFEIPNCPSQESICASLECITPCSCRSHSLERLRVSDTGGSRGPVLL